MLNVKYKCNKPSSAMSAGNKNSDGESPEIIEKAREAIQNLLPEKSKTRYNKNRIVANDDDELIPPEIIEKAQEITQ